MFDDGDVFRVKSNTSLFFEDLARDLKKGELLLKPGQIGFVLQDVSGKIALTGEDIVFLYVFIDGRTGWLLDDCIEVIP